MNKQILKRVIAFLLLGALVLGALVMVKASKAAKDGSASIGIIGGADGPTAIFVTGNWGGVVSTLLLIAGGICGIVAVAKVLQKRKK